MLVLLVKKNSFDMEVSIKRPHKFSENVAKNEKTLAMPFIVQDVPTIKGT